MVGPLRLSPVVELNKQNLGLEQQRQHHRPALRRTKAVEVEQRGMSSSSKESQKLHAIRRYHMNQWSTMYVN